MGRILQGARGGGLVARARGEGGQGTVRFGGTARRSLAVSRAARYDCNDSPEKSNFFSRRMTRAAAILFTIAALAVAALAGCGGSQPAAPAGAAANASGSAVKTNGVLPAKLRLLVVGDAAIAQRINRLRGEWSARTGGTLEVSETTPAELATAKSLAADLVIYPSSEIGTLAERRLIRPMPTVWLDAGDFHKADLFELPGLHETAWGEQIYAVPLGSPVFVCFYRADLFDKLGQKPPQTWAEYQQLVEFYDRQKSPGGQPGGRLQSGTLEPLAASWAGNVLLARAAAYAKHRDYYSTLFDKDSLEPRIATEPFVRALNGIGCGCQARTEIAIGRYACRCSPRVFRRTCRDGHELADGDRQPRFAARSHSGERRDNEAARAGNAVDLDRLL